MQLHEALAGKQTHGQLLPGHFQIENGNGFLVLFRHVNADIQRKGGLTHGGPGGDKQKVGLVQSVDPGVQIPQAGGQAGDQGIRLAQLCQAVEHLVQRRADVLQRVAPLALAQGVNFLFRRFQHLGGGSHLFRHHLLNVRRGLIQSPKHGLFLHNGRIARHIGGGGGDLHQLEDVIPGIVVVVAQLLQLVQHRDRVNGLGEVEHGIDGFINFPVLLQVKILRLHNAHHIRNAPAVDENGTQDRLLRLQRLGLLPGQKFFIHGKFSFLYRI